MLDTHKESIYRWRRKGRDHGMAGLAKGWHPGRTGALDEVQSRYPEQLADSIRQLMTLI